MMVFEESRNSSASCSWWQQSEWQPIMTEIVDIHVTCSTLEEARQLSHRLLDAKLAACCQIGKDIDSRYWYGGKQHRGDESPLVIKTRGDFFDRVAAMIRESHSYETPAIIGFKPDYVDEATKAWIAETCTGEADGD